MEQRIQKLNSPAQPGNEDSLPFPFEVFRTALVKLPPKRVSNTSSDSGVNTPPFPSPAMPITPDNSQSYLVPSTSRTNPSSGPLTPMKQFISKSRKSKAKNLNIVVSSPIILTHCQCFELALDKAINYNFLILYIV